MLALKRPQISWTLIRGESNVQGGGGNGSIEERAGEGVGAAGEVGPLAPGQRWSVGRKRDALEALLAGGEAQLNCVDGTPVPALPLIGQLLLGVGLLAGGARQLYRWTSG